jgi:glycerol-3-phosphate O-acyltransferase
MTHVVAFMAGAAAVLLLALVGAGLAARWWRGWTHRAAMRVHKRYGARIDRFKFAGREAVIARLLDDPAIRDAAREHAATQGGSEEEAMARVRGYLEEMVPEFSLWLYYRFGLAISEALLRLLFRVEVVDKRPGAVAALPRDAVVIYLMNHRSNADYVLAGYALAGQVAISYAVGEWARVFPLEYLFKAFGAYFIRRRFREPLYHAVLGRYVHLITRNGVTQGIFPEGGLSRDGRFRPAKIGLLNHILGAARDPELGARVFVVPVAINYDRVLEDRSLLRELQADEGHRPPPRLVQFGIVLWYVAWNALRIVARRWKRHGDAVIVIGEPVPLAPWFAGVRARHGADFESLAREARLREVQDLADDTMRRIGALMPVPAVPLVCAALQTLDVHYVERERLVAHVDHLREALAGGGAELVAPDEPTHVLVDRALALLWIRRAVVRDRGGVAVLPRGRELVAYYANSIAHLLGDLEPALRSRDILPVYEVVDL